MSMTMIPIVAITMVIMAIITMSTMSIAIMTIVTVVGLFHLLTDGHPYGRVSRRQKLEKYNRDTDCEVVAIMVIFWDKNISLKNKHWHCSIDIPTFTQFESYFEGGATIIFYLFIIHTNRRLVLAGRIQISYNVPIICITKHT